MNATIRVKLSFMMFLEFFIWGSWFVSLGTYLGITLKASGADTGAIFSTQSWGAIIAPFIVGLIADRYFNAEKILGVIHLIGAALLYQAYTSSSVDILYPYILGYMILYMPTLGLVNSVAFNQMQDPEKEFGKIRMWGTIGWIVAGALISYVFFWDSEKSIQEGLLRNTFLMASIASLVLGILSFTLPKTPPKVDKNEKIKIGELLGFDALKLLKDKNFAVFFISAILICIPLAFYYQVAHPYLEHAGIEKVTVKMTIGQISEALFLLLIPVFFKKYGFKKTILVGMLAWSVRYLLFAYGNGHELAFMLYIGIALHGICYDFFFVSGQIYTNSKAGIKYKSSAQGLITLATYGVGMLIGFKIAGMISDSYKLTDGSLDYKMIWIIPAGIAFVVFLLFALFFNDKTKPETEASI
jgi:nucleoside transporter